MDLEIRGLCLALLLIVFVVVLFKLSFNWMDRESEKFRLRRGKPFESLTFFL